MGFLWFICFFASFCWLIRSVGAAPRKPARFLAPLLASIISFSLFNSSFGNSNKSEAIASSSSGNADDATPDAAPTVEATPSPHLIYQGKSIPGIVVDDIFYGVIGVRVTNSIGPDNEFIHATKPSDAGRFVIVSLIIQNRSNSTQATSVSSSTLTDTAGKHYSTSSDGETALMMYGNDSHAEFLLSQVQPQLKTRVDLVFDVPAQDRAFRFSPSDDQGEETSIGIRT